MSEDGGEEQKDWQWASDLRLIHLSENFSLVKEFISVEEFEVTKAKISHQTDSQNPFHVEDRQWITFDLLKLHDSFGELRRIRNKVAGNGFTTMHSKYFTSNTCVGKVAVKTVVNHLKADYAEAEKKFGQARDEALETVDKETLKANLPAHIDEVLQGFKFKNKKLKEEFRVYLLETAEDFLESRFRVLKTLSFKFDAYQLPKADAIRAQDRLESEVALDIMRDLIASLENLLKSLTKARKMEEWTKKNNNKWKDKFKSLKATLSVIDKEIKRRPRKKPGEEYYSLISSYVDELTEATTQSYKQYETRRDKFMRIKRGQLPKYQLDMDGLKAKPPAKRWDGISRQNHQATLEQ